MQAVTKTAILDGRGATYAEPGKGTWLTSDQPDLSAPE